MYGHPGVLTYAADYRVHDEVIALLTKANSAGVTVYAFETSGLEVGTSSRADVEGPVSILGGPTVDTLRRSMSEAPLMALTGETGGRLVRSSNTTFELLNALGDDLSVYYSIGFPTRETSIQQERRIEVSVRRPGVTARFRRSVRPLSNAERRVNRTLAALYVPIEDNPLEAKVRQVGVKGNGRKREVSFDLLIPTDTILLVPEGGKSLVSLEALIACRDDRGDASPVRRVDISGTIPTSSDDGSRLVLTHRITLRIEPGRHRVAISIHDLYGNTTSILTNTIEIE